MAKLTGDVARLYELGDINSYPLLGNVEIFEGSAVGINASGYVRPLEAGDKFGGFALEKVDNSENGDGEKRVDTRTQGSIVIDAPSGITQASIGTKIYASDDNTFTTLATNNTLIGVITKFANSEITVRFVAFS